MWIPSTLCREVSYPAPVVLGLFGLSGNFPFSSSWGGGPRNHGAVACQDHPVWVFNGLPGTLHTPTVQTPMMSRRFFFDRLLPNVKKSIGLASRLTSGRGLNNQDNKNHERHRVPGSKRTKTFPPLQDW